MRKTEKQREAEYAAWLEKLDHLQLVAEEDRMAEQMNETRTVKRQRHLIEAERQRRIERMIAGPRMIQVRHSEVVATRERIVERRAAR